MRAIKACIRSGADDIAAAGKTPVGDLFLGKERIKSSHLTVVSDWQGIDRSSPSDFFFLGTFRPKNANAY